MASIPAVQLASKTATIPQIGFGTADYPFSGQDAIKIPILEAIEAGYRHFDTAALYETEKALGDAVSEAIRLGFIKSRDELFITSKLWCCDAHPELVLPALTRTLENLGLEYLDLYLVHWPLSSKSRNLEFPVKEEDMVGMDFEGVWRHMEECLAVGLAKSIGVSNFSCKKLESLLATARIRPAINQVEMNPGWQQKKLRDYCDAVGIKIAAYAPLGAKGMPWGSSRVMNSHILKQIAENHGKTVAQVCLRWAYEQGVIFIVKSFNKKRMKENLEIFDWELTPQDHHTIKQIPQHRSTTGEYFTSQQGPFRSTSELWDGEI